MERIRKLGPSGRLIAVLRLVLLEAVPAIYRPALCRLERYLSLSSAVGAGYVMHLAWSIVSWAPVAARSLFSVHITNLPTVLFESQKPFQILAIGDSLYRSS